MSDLVWRLRSMARNEHDDLSVGDEAADEIERLRAEVARLTAERDALAVELKRVQRLPELEWAEACSRIMHVLASAARAGFPVRDSVAIAAMDAGKTYVDRILAERDALLARVEAAEKDAARYRWLRGDAPPYSLRWMRWEVRYWNGEYWDDLRTDKLNAALDAAMREKP